MPCKEQYNNLWIDLFEVVNLLLTRHTDVMTTTTITKQSADCLLYANDERAFFLNEGQWLASLPLQSSAIQWWSYELGTGVLTVQYQSSDTFYRYQSVPFHVIFDLMLAESLGHFIAKEVKPNYSVA